MEPIEGKILGKQVDYPQQYMPDILVAVPRALNREIYQLNADKLPFKGVDIWHAYELSFLTEKGLPVAGLLKLSYAADSEFLVESKSLKLYLNGFNMEHYGANHAEGIEKILSIIEKDLSTLLKTRVSPAFFDGDMEATDNDFSPFSLLEKLPGVQDLHFSHFSETPSLLVPEVSAQKEQKVATHLLRSNCKITHQPDWGSAFIHIKGENLPKQSGLLQYLVSIRNENHFHEEICEMIYKRLWDAFSPKELMVTCIYTRRGGIDICPVRVSHDHLLPHALCNVNQLSKRLLRQ
jgi:7-cyano-7-deazaguanine reductase